MSLADQRGDPSGGEWMEYLRRLIFNVQELQRNLDNAGWFDASKTAFSVEILAKAIVAKQTGVGASSHSPHSRLPLAATTPAASTTLSSRRRGPLLHR